MFKKSILLQCFAIMIVICCLLKMEVVLAKDNVYYTNINEVNFTLEEYNYISDLIWDGYQKYMTKEEYETLKKLNLFGAPIFTEQKELDVGNKIMLKRGDTLTEKGRTIKISKICSDECFVSLVNTWNAPPAVKSYDVIGVRTETATIKRYTQASVIGNNYSQIYTNPKIFNNGMGYSIKVPNTTNIKITTTFITTLNGKIFGTYQHAMRNISLANSKLYNISANGYGKVLKFYGAALNKYDACNGVDIVL